MKNTVFFNIRLSQTQLNVLHAERAKIDRFHCLFLMLDLVEATPREYSIKGFKTVLQPGQVAVSTVELGTLWKCERKTVTRILAIFNKAGIVSTNSNNRTSVHTLSCICGWTPDGQPSEDVSRPSCENPGDSQQPEKRKKKKKKKSKKNKKPSGVENGVDKTPDGSSWDSNEDVEKLANERYAGLVSQPSDGPESGDISSGVILVSCNDSAGTCEKEEDSSSEAVPVDTEQEAKGARDVPDVPGVQSGKRAFADWYSKYPYLAGNRKRGEETREGGGQNDKR